MVGVEPTCSWSQATRGAAPQHPENCPARDSNPHRRLEGPGSLTVRRTGRIPKFDSGPGGARILVCGASNRRYTVSATSPHFDHHGAQCAGEQKSPTSGATPGQRESPLCSGVAAQSDRLGFIRRQAGKRPVPIQTGCFPREEGHNGTRTITEVTTDRSRSGTHARKMRAGEGMFARFRRNPGNRRTIIRWRVRRELLHPASRLRRP